MVGFNSLFCFGGLVCTYCKATAMSLDKLPNASEDFYGSSDTKDESV